jgi:hypothetical protein
MRATRHQAVNKRAALCNPMLSSSLETKPNQPAYADLYLLMKASSFGRQNRNRETTENRRAHDNLLLSFSVTFWLVQRLGPQDFTLT